MGEHDYTDSSDGQISVTPSSWLAHPSYDSSTTNYDFALLKLSTALSFSSAVMPACLPDSSTDYDAVTAVVTGWGTTSSGGNQPNVLMEAEVTTRWEDHHLFCFIQHLTYCDTSARNLIFSLLAFQPFPPLSLFSDI